MNNKLPTVSIGIVALNEGDNIKKMLSSVLSQKQDGYKVEKILVISDGSEDKTVKEVASLKNDLIEILEFKKRIGKSSHLNTIFKNVSSDIVVLFDADIILQNEHTIKNLIQPLISTETIKFVGGNPQPILGHSLIEKAVNVSFTPYDQIRTILNNGNNPYGCDGRILALKKEFYKKVTVPADMIANDNYMYFLCLTSEHEFKHVRDAVVYFRSPVTLADQLRQNKRFIAARKRMHRIFGDVVPEAYTIPRNLKMKYILLQLIRHPFLSVVIFIINLYCAYLAKHEEETMTAEWEIAETTKHNIKT